MPISVLFRRDSETGQALKENLENAPVNQNIIVNWTGNTLLLDPPEVVLNAYSRSDKLSQAIRLATAGVPTITVSLRKEGDEWLARRASHQQGFDFTNKRLQRGVVKPDYFVKKEDIVDEWRVHVFRTKKDNMRVLRCARKLPSTPDHHPWVRSHRLGWKLSYVGGCPESGRTISREALRALQLDFGAADIGFRRDGSPLVLEINTCPGLEGGTLAMYVENILERVQ